MRATSKGVKTASFDVAFLQIVCLFFNQSRRSSISLKHGRMSLLQWPSLQLLNILKKCPPFPGHDVFPDSSVLIPKYVARVVSALTFDEPRDVPGFLLKK